MAQIGPIKRVVFYPKPVVAPVFLPVRKPEPVERERELVPVTPKKVGI